MARRPRTSVSWTLLTLEEQDNVGHEYPVPRPRPRPLSLSFSGLAARRFTRWKVRANGCRCILARKRGATKGRGKSKGKLESDSESEGLGSFTKRAKIEVVIKQDGDDEDSKALIATPVKRRGRPPSTCKAILFSPVLASITDLLLLGASLVFHSFTRH